MSELYFRLGPPEGFTSIKTADKKSGYAIPIRELLQNSMDASRDPDLPKCEVDVYIETIAKKDIPHIKKYQEVLKLAKKTQKDKGGLGSGAKRRIHQLEQALQQSSLDVLMWVDNGTGMSKDKLEAILSGGSVKDEKSGGSFGVGNLSSYWLSALQYVLYATKCKTANGKTQAFFTGSPILAGHNDGAQRGNRGQIVAGWPDDEMDPNFEYPSEFPKFLRSQMDGVKHGTMVCILGLNEEWDDTAEYAIASNFFHAIVNDKLVVRVRRKDGSSTEIDDRQVGNLIEKYKDKSQWATKDQGSKLSGMLVHQAWQAVTNEGNKVAFVLSNDDTVHVYIKNNTDTDSSAIVLVRNGMVIARNDTISRRVNALRKQSNFDFEPFTAVIDVDQQHAPRLFELVRGAESRHHNELDGKRLNDEHQEFSKFLRELCEHIKGALTPVKREASSLSFFEYASGFAVESTGTQRTVAQRSTAVEQEEDIPKPKPQPNPNPNPPPPPRPKPEPKIRDRVLDAKPAFRYNAEQNGWVAKLAFCPVSYDPQDETYLSVALGADLDKTSRANVKFLEFESLEQNGKKVPIDKNQSQINLGQLAQGTSYNITARLKLGSGNAVGAEVALMPILGLKRAKPNKGEN